MKRPLFCLLSFVVVALFCGNRVANKSAAPTYNIATDTSIVQMLDVTAITATNNDYISTWAATVGNNAVQATGDNQFQYKTGQQNGLPALVDDGSGSAKYMATASFGTLAQPYTIWIVMKAGSTASYPAFIDGLSTSNRAIFYGNAGVWDMAAMTDTNGGTMDTNWHIFCLKFNGASSSITIDGDAPTTVNPGTNSFVGMTIGAAYDGSLRGQMSVGQIIVQNALPPNEAGLLAHLRDKWGTY